MVRFIEREKVNGVERRNLCNPRLKDIAARFHGRTEAHVKAHSISIGRVVSSVINLGVGIEVAILPCLQCLIIMFGPPFCDRKMNSTV